MFSHPERLIIALMIALLFAGVTMVAVEASSQSSLSLQGEIECAVCHAQFMETWKKGPHGQATIDPNFNEAWDAQGNPGACLVCHTTGYDPETGTWEQDGVTCEACHGPIPEDHPVNPAPIDRSPVLCGSCHSSARFGWEDWEVSAHYQRDMTCINCHGPHQATLKSATPPGEEHFDDASQLCINCHTEYIQNCNHSTHCENDVSCVDCHLPLNNETFPAHTTHDHSFQATLNSCNACHTDQMHENGDATAREESINDAPPEVMLSSVALTSEPAPVSPLGFAGLASLIGLAAGTVLAPWLEGKYKAIKRNGSDQDE